MNKEKKKHFLRLSDSSKSKGINTNSKHIQSIKKNLETPKAKIHFCGIHTPQYFSGCTVARYKVSIYFDENDKEHNLFLGMIKGLAKENGVHHIGKKTDDGLIIISFQGREIPETLYMKKGKKRAIPVELEHDMPPGTSCTLKFNLNKYFDKRAQQPAFNFAPVKVTFHSEDNDKIELI